MNAYADTRFVGSVKSECMRHVAPLGEQHPRMIVRDYVEHHHHERDHQVLGNVTPLPLARCGTGPVRRHERLTSILGHCRREAA